LIFEQQDMKEKHLWGISGGGVSIIGATHISLAYDTLLWLGFWVDIIFFYLFFCLHRGVVSPCILHKQPRMDRKFRIS